MPLEGWLWKQGVKGIVKGWKNRWFAMPNDFELHYYQSNTALESLGYIDIRIVSSVVADPSKKKDAKGYLFYINTPARVYNLAANTEKELSYWVDGLNAILPDRKRTMSVNLSQLQVESNDKVLAEKEREKQQHDEMYSLDLMTQLLKEKDAKFEVLSKEAAKQRIKLESCERELAIKEEKLSSLTDQVQNLTSLVAHEKQSNETGSEESARQKAKLQQLADMIEVERSSAIAANSKLSTLETANATLRAQNEALAQSNSKLDADSTRTREDALAKVRDADARVAAVKAENELLNQSVLHLQATLKDGSESRNRDSLRMDKSNADLQHTIANLEQLLKERGEEVRALQEKWDSSQQTIKEVWDQINETRRVKDEEVRAKEQDINEWKAKHAAALQEASGKGGDVTALQERMDNTQKALEEMTVKWGDMAKELEEKKNEVEVWSDTCMKAQQNLEAKTSEVDKANEAWMATLKEKEDEKESWRAKFEAKTKELEQTSEAWMSALKDKDAEKDSWKAKYDTATEQTKEMEKAIEVWMATIQEKETEKEGWKAKWEQSQEEGKEAGSRRREEDERLWQTKVDAAVAETASWKKEWEAVQAEEKKWKAKQEETQQKFEAFMAQQEEAKEEWIESTVTKGKALEEYTAKWDEAQNALEAKDGEIAGLQKRVEDWKGRWEEVDGKLKHIDAETKHLIDEWKQKVQALHTSNSELAKKSEAELNELRAKLVGDAEWQVKLDILQAEVEGKAKEVEEWQQKVVKLRQEVGELQDKEAARQADSVLQGSEVARQLEEKGKELQQKLDELVQDRNREREELKQQLSDAESRVAAKEVELKDLQAKLEEWNSKSNDMGREADEKEAELKILQARVSELEVQSAEWKQQLDSALHDTSKGGFEKEIEEWKSKWDFKIADVERETQDWQKKLNESESAVKEWQEKARHAEERASQEIDALQLKLGETVKEMEGPNKEAQELELKLVEVEEKFAKEIEELKQTLLEKKNEADEKEKELEGRGAEAGQAVHTLNAKISELEQALNDKDQKVRAWELKYTDERDKFNNMEEMYNYLKEKAEQVEEWKQKWSAIENSLIERVKEDDELRARLDTLQHDYEAKVAEAEHFKTKWWEGKEKVDEAQRVALEREEESEKWRLRWEELNSDVKSQESSITEMGKEWDVIHKSLLEELSEWKENAKTREDALNAVSVFLDQLTTHEEPTENGVHEGESNGTSIKRRKISLPTKALQGKYEPLSQRGIVLYQMLEQKRHLELENRNLNREVRVLKGEEPLSLSTELAQSEAKRQEELLQLTAELEEIRRSESELRDALRGSEDNLRHTTTLLREETEQLKSELAAERLARASVSSPRIDDADATADAMQMLELAQEQVGQISSQVGAMLRETQANEAANQVLKDAEEAIGVLHAKVSFLAQELEFQRSTAAADLEVITTTSQAQVEEAQRKLVEQEGAARALQERVDELTRASQDVASVTATTTSAETEGFRKRIGELEDELRVKEDEFRIIRQVRQGEMLLKEEEIRKKDAQLQELRTQWQDPTTAVPITGASSNSNSRDSITIGGSREFLHAYAGSISVGGVRDRSSTDLVHSLGRPPLQHSISALDLIQRSPRSMHSYGATNNEQALKAKIDELVVEVKAKKEELRTKEDDLAAHELEIQELKMKISDIEMEAKQREIEMEHAAQMKIAELEHEVQMKVAELDQVVRTKDIELQIKEVELRTVSNQVAVVESTNEIMRAEADVVEEAVTRVQEETIQHEEEVNDLYTRLDMAEQVVRQAQDNVAQKEQEVQELNKKLELLEGWLHEKENELDHSHNEKQKSIQ